MVLSRARPPTTDEPPQKRVAVDFAPMTKEMRELDTRQKTEPEAGASVQPAPLGELMRKLRWSIIGLEYHVRLAQAVTCLLS